MLQCSVKENTLKMQCKYKVVKMQGGGCKWNAQCEELKRGNAKTTRGAREALPSRVSA